MLTTAPRLRIRRPSPTTVEFTVTTLPPPTLSLRLLRALLLLLRISLTVATLLLLHARWAASPFAPASYLVRPEPDPSDAGTRLLIVHIAVSSLAYFHHSPAGAAFTRLAVALPLAALLPAAVAAFYVLSRRVHASEGLLVLRGLGVQTTESPRSYLAGRATRFIPTEKIQDILVNEAFRGFEVRYYLVVVVEGEENVVVVFPGLLPGRAIVETVWRGARECLYEGRGTEGKSPLL